MKLHQTREALKRKVIAAFAAQDEIYQIRIFGHEAEVNLLMKATPTNSQLNQREFLTYSFLAALLLFGTVILTTVVWYALPEPNHIRVGRVTDFPPDTPAPGVYPLAADGLIFYLVNTGSELIAFDSHTPYARQGCIFKWVPITGRFEDPCSASKFAPDGTWLEGPATRDLDRFPLKVTDGQIWVNTSTSIKGSARAEYMTCLARYNQPGVSCWPAH